MKICPGPLRTDPSGGVILCDTAYYGPHIGGIKIIIASTNPVDVLMERYNDNLVTIASQILPVNGFLDFELKTVSLMGKGGVLIRVRNSVLGEVQGSIYLT